MKIVFYAPFGIRPKGTVLARMIPLASELQTIGYEVVIVAPPYTNPEDSGKMEMVKGVRLVNMTLPSCGKVLGTVQLAWRMFLAMHAEKPDLVHLFKPKGYGGLAAILHITLQRLGMRLPPLLVDTDDWEGKGGMNDLQPYSQTEKRFFAFQEQWLLRHASGVTVASRELERLAREMGGAPKQILYLPNCVEDSTPGNGMQIRKKLSIPDGTPLVLLYTRFFEFSQERLYRVFVGIYRQVSGVRFLVVGKGRKREEKQLELAARDMGFDAALVMAGWLEPQVIPDYLAAADIAVYPLDDNLVNRAKCPAKLTELLLAGVPVVADGVGQAFEYIANGLSGVVCDPGAPERMVDEIVALLREPERRRRLGAEGRSYLLDHFTWYGAARTLDQLYRRETNS
jgi:glycosyltransferase involved in cell wall biosynthesis